MVDLMRLGTLIDKRPELSECDSSEPASEPTFWTTTELDLVMGQIMLRAFARPQMYSERHRARVRLIAFLRRHSHHEQ